MNSSHLHQYEFQLLYAQLYERLRLHISNDNRKLEIPEPHQYAKISGVYYGTQNPDKIPNLCDLLNDDLKVALVLQSEFEIAKKKRFESKKKFVTGSALYQMLGDFGSKNSAWDEIAITDFYQKVFCAFLEYADLNDFRTKNFRCINYKGYYFSEEKGVVASFAFQLIHESSNNITEGGKQVFISISKIYDTNDNIVLRGQMRPFQECWIAEASSTEHYLHLSFHLAKVYSNFEEISQNRHFYGIFKGSSSRKNPVTAEFVLIKENELQSETEIKKYLNLRRKAFHILIPSEALTNAADLKVRGVSLKKLETFAEGSIYRIISRTPKGYVMQTRFEIKQDYSAQIYIPGQPEALPCRLILDNVGENRLIVNVYKKDGILYMTTVLEFLPFSAIDKIIPGAFCITDGTISQIPHASQFVMQMEKSGFQAIRYDDLSEDLLSKDPRLEILIDMLDSNAKKKTENIKDNDTF